MARPRPWRRSGRCSICSAKEPRPAADIMICPPATLLAQARYALGKSDILLGGQDCHPEPEGAHTGDISAEMLADAGAKAVIVGHSERRRDHGETDALVAAKAAAAHRAGLAAIICIGETEQERREGATLGVVGRQLDGSLPPSATAENSIIAYEPVWAIGTGLTPTPSDVAEVHGFIRGSLARAAGARGGRQNPHPLWRLRQAEQCPRAPCRRQRQWRPGRRAPASRPPISMLSYRLIRKPAGCGRPVGGR